MTDLNNIKWVKTIQGNKLGINHSLYFITISTEVTAATGYENQYSFPLSRLI